MRVIMTAANCSLAVASRRAEYDGDFRVSTLLGDSMQNIDMAVEPEEGGELAHGPKQPASQCAPRRAGKPSRLMEPHGCSAREALAGASDKGYVSKL